MQNSSDKENLIKNIDYNCDLGQSEDLWENEKILIDYMSSINITCGIHAGNPAVIKKVLDYSRYKNKVIGAHIGFPPGYKFDINNINKEEIEAIVLYQVGAIASFAKSYGLLIEHVRPHGQMYKEAMESSELAIAIAKGISKFSKWLIYYGASCPAIKEAAAVTNINIAQEISLTKNYTEAGIIDLESFDTEDKEKALARLKTLIETSEIDTANDGRTKIEFDTIHFSPNVKDSADLAKEAYTIKVPRPVNYNRAEVSGWI